MSVSKVDIEKLFQLEQDAAGLIEQFLIAAVTLVYEGRKVSKYVDAQLQHVVRFDIPVPEFLMPAADEYVYETCKKVVSLIRENNVEGLAVHFRENLLLRQRFVIKFHGEWMFTPEMIPSAHDIIENMRNEYRKCIQKIESTNHKLREIKFNPSWSMSFGIKRKLQKTIDDGGPNPFSHTDNTVDHFPWKRRPVSPTKHVRTATPNCTGREDSATKQTPGTSAPQKIPQPAGAMNPESKADDGGERYSVYTFAITDGLLLDAYFIDYSEIMEPLLRKTIAKEKRERLQKLALIQAAHGGTAPTN